MFVLTQGPPGGEPNSGIAAPNVLGAAHRLVWLDGVFLDTSKLLRTGLFTLRAVAIWWYLKFRSLSVAGGPVPPGAQTSRCFGELDCLL